MTTAEASPEPSAPAGPGADREIAQRESSHETARPLAAQLGSSAPSVSHQKRYVAFISYKHHAALPFAERIAGALRTYARPLLRPPMRIFRDEDHLVPNENLPKAIRRALEDSEYLILLASKEAAKSTWVADEIRIWCAELERTRNLLVVLSKDRLVYDEKSKRIDWEKTNALPDGLAAFMSEVPLYVDLSWITDEKQLDLANALFKRSINVLSAALHGNIDPEQMLNREVIAHRRNLWLSRGAIGAVLVFALVALVGFLSARQSLARERTARQHAEVESQRAAANLIANRAQHAASASRQVSSLLAAEAIGRLRAHGIEPTAPALQTLLDFSREMSGIGLRGHDHVRLKDAQDGTAISAVSVSADSRWFATGDDHGRVVLRTGRDADTFFTLAQGQAGRKNELEIQGLSFSPDSHRLAATMLDQVVIWDVEDMPHEVARARGLGSYTYDARFTVDGRYLVVAGSGIRVWDTADPSSSLRFLPASATAQHAVLAMGDELIVSDTGRAWQWKDADAPFIDLDDMDGSPYSIAVSPGGDAVAVGTTDGHVHVWDLVALRHQRYEHGGFIESVAFSPDGRSVASASWEKTVKIWDLTGKNAPKTLEHPDKVQVVAFHPSGKILATLDRDSRVRLWGTGRSNFGKVELSPLDADGGGTQLVFAPDGSFLVVGGFEPVPRFWSLGALRAGMEWYESNTYEHLESLAVSAGTKRIAAVARYSPPELWTFGEPHRSSLPLERASHNAFQVALSPDGRWIATSSVGSVGSSLWDSNNPLSAPRKLLASTSYHNEVAFTPDSRFVAGMQEDGAIVLESVSSTEKRTTLTCGVTKPPVDFDLSSDGAHLVAAYRDGAVALWDLKQRTFERLDHTTGDPHSVVFLPDGSGLVLAGESFVSFTAIGAKDWASLVLPRGAEITKIAVAPDSRAIAAGTKQGDTLFWRLASRAEAKTLAGHTREVIDIEFAPDAGRLASATTQSVRVWSLADLDEPPVRLESNCRVITKEYSDPLVTSVTAVRFYDSDHLIASTDSGVVSWDINVERLQRAACEVAGRQLTANETTEFLDGTPAVGCTGQNP